MLSFNFNKNKKTGVSEIKIGDKTIVEVVVQGQISKSSLTLVGAAAFLMSLTSFGLPDHAVHDISHAVSMVVITLYLTIVIIMTIIKK